MSAAQTPPAPVGPPAPAAGDDHPAAPAEKKHILDLLMLERQADENVALAYQTGGQVSEALLKWQEIADQLDAALEEEDNQ